MPRFPIGGSWYVGIIGVFPFHEEGLGIGVLLLFDY